jgi:hypothetical protein
MWQFAIEEDASARMFVAPLISRIGGQYADDKLLVGRDREKQA